LKFKNNGKAGNQAVVEEMNQKLELGFARSEVLREWSELIKVCTKVSYYDNLQRSRDRIRNFTENS
jgi:hypothetical protein